MDLGQVPGCSNAMGDAAAVKNLLGWCCRRSGDALSAWMKHRAGSDPWSSRRSEMGLGTAPGLQWWFNDPSCVSLQPLTELGDRGDLEGGTGTGWAPGVLREKGAAVWCSSQSLWEGKWALMFLRGWREGIQSDALSSNFSIFQLSTALVCNSQSPEPVSCCSPVSFWLNNFSLGLKPKEFYYLGPQKM